MFQFPAFALPGLYIQPGVTRRLTVPGFPIRTSPDQRLFADSPGLIAGCRVLRRLSMPRHPPYTLSSLITFTDHRHARPAVRASRLPSFYSDAHRAGWEARPLDHPCGQPDELER